MFFAGHTLINHGFMLSVLYVRNGGRYGGLRRIAGNAHGGVIALSGWGPASRVLFSARPAHLPQWEKHNVHPQATRRGGSADRVKLHTGPGAAGDVRARLLRVLLSICQLPEQGSRQSLYRPELPAQRRGELGPVAER